MFNPGVLVSAIYGPGTRVEGGCCAASRLETIEHPVYRCRACGKKVRLVKVVKIVAKVEREDLEDSSAEKK